jgi:hypothetical protein
VKIILKKNVKGNEQMVYDELEMLQRMKHPHIVKFVDWFESRVSSGNPSGVGYTYRFRINTTSSLSLPQEASYSIVSASKEDSQKKMPLKPFDRFSKLSIISTITMSSTGVMCSINNSTTGTNAS